jgi:hypothetical protein
MQGQPTWESIRCENQQVASDTLLRLSPRPQQTSKAILGGKEVPRDGRSSEQLAVYRQVAAAIRRRIEAFMRIARE